MHEKAIKEIKANQIIFSNPQSADQSRHLSNQATCLYSYKSNYKQTSLKQDRPWWPSGLRHQQCSHKLMAEDQGLNPAQGRFTN